MSNCALCRTSNDTIVSSAPHPAPLSRGHTLLFPVRHVGSYWSCTAEERGDLQRSLRAQQKEFDALFQPDGYAVGFSTEQNHFYLELIPQYGEALHPYPFQRNILERLQEERSTRGLRRNLLVAATGSGKTMMAAFDYARQQSRPRLLFVAHRAELLIQARDTFREVLQLPSFGELLFGDEKPASDEYLFATIQSIESSQLLKMRSSDYWQFVVVDECHHIPAPSYRALIERLKPTILLGLTGTPERSDGQSLLPDFGGRISAELRLWHALERKIVAPFAYYGIADKTDLRALDWSRGAYNIAALDKVYTGDDRRADLIIKAFQEKRGHWQSRALGFCVSVAHAEFMAKKFIKSGIPALVVHGKTTPKEREEAPRKLEARQVNIIFTCDLYNEGVDLPFVDMLLFLRPTASSTVFLQQLGRGLRLFEGKPHCLVLDFIGQHRKEFRMEKLLSAMTGVPQGRIREAVEADFPVLPSGCKIVLEKVAKENILANLKEAIGGKKRISEVLRGLPPETTLAKFLEETSYELEHIYKAGGWSTLRHLAGFLPGLAESEQRISEKLKFLLHVDDAERLEVMRTLQAEERSLLMLGYQLFDDEQDKFTAAEVERRFTAQLCQELKELAEVLSSKAHAKNVRVRDGWPLGLHRTYSRREILAALGHWNSQQKRKSREGTLALDAEKTELFFVTIDKNAKRFTERTSYHDYAISDALFHWESQSKTSDTTMVGRRYIEQSKNGWTFLLFVRATTEENYVALGPVHYVSHTGNKPMKITWRMEHPIPFSVQEFCENPKQSASA